MLKGRVTWRRSENLKRSRKRYSAFGSVFICFSDALPQSYLIIIIIINLPQTGKDKYKRCKPVQGTVQNTKITTKYNISYKTKTTLHNKIPIHESNTTLTINYLENATKVFICSMAKGSTGCNSQDINRHLIPDKT